jgi:hypothetical protein
MVWPRRGFRRLRALSITIGITYALMIAAPGAAAALGDVDVVFQGSEYKGGEPSIEPGTGVLPARYALVIGIDTYRSNALSLQVLNHASSDAHRVGEALADAGFAVTELTTNAGPITRNALLNEVEAFNAKVHKANRRPPILAVYFSGHGVSTLAKDGSRHQYIIPSDFQPIVADDVAEMAIPIEELLSRLGRSGPSLRIVIIDACRSDISKALPTGMVGVSSQFEPWQKFEPSDPTPKNGARNGLLLLYATGARGAAADGLLADALVDSLQQMRANAKATNTGRVASFYALASAIGNAVQGANGNDQRSEFFPNTSDFFVFATQNDRDIEVFNWEAARRIKARDTISGYKEYWCRLEAMKNGFSEYSYLSPLIDSEQSDEYHNSCANTVLSVSLDPSDRLDDQAEISVHQFLDSAAPSLDKVATGFGASLDQSSSADRLAYAAYQAKVFSEPDAESSVVGTISEGDLVQLREGTDSNYIAVKMTNGSNGFIARSALLRGRAAIDETLQFRNSQFEVSASDLRLDDLLSNVVVTDVLVHYPFGDHLIGLTRAQNVAAILAGIANRGETRSLVPRVFPVDSDSPEGERLALNQVRLTFSVAPLRKDVRAALGSPMLAGKLTLADSIDVTVLGDRLRSLALPVRQASTKTTGNDAGPTVVPRHGPGISDADRCAAASKDLPRSEDQSLVFIQISTPEQERDYDTVAAGLRSIGFVVPAIDLRPPVQRNRVLYCPGGKRAEAAERVAAALKRCGFDQFSTAPIVDYPDCDKEHDNRVEVWFAEPAKGN